MSESFIEELYSSLERDLKGYKRPADYRERALKLAEKSRKPVRAEHEGRRYENW